MGTKLVHFFHTAVLTDTTYTAVGIQVIQVGDHLGRTSSAMAPEKIAAEMPTAINVDGLEICF